MGERFTNKGGGERERIKKKAVAVSGEAVEVVGGEGVLDGSQFIFLPLC